MMKAYSDFLHDKNASLFRSIAQAGATPDSAGQACSHAVRRDGGAWMATDYCNRGKEYRKSPISARKPSMPPSRGSSRARPAPRSKEHDPDVPRPIEHPEIRRLTGATCRRLPCSQFGSLSQCHPKHRKLKLIRVKYRICYGGQDDDEYNIGLERAWRLNGCARVGIFFESILSRRPHPACNVPRSMQDAPDVDFGLPLDVEDKIRILPYGPEAQADEVELMRITGRTRFRSLADMADGIFERVDEAQCNRFSRLG